MKKTLKILTVLSIVAVMPMVAFGQIIGGSSQASSVNVPRDGIVADEYKKFEKPVPYPYVREADIAWQKRVWEVIDFREKVNQGFYYPLKPSRSRKSLVTVLLDAIHAGELTAYDAEKDDEFTTPLSISQVDDMLQGSQKSEAVYDANGQYVKDTVIYVGNFDKAEVKKVRLKEVWFFDKKRSQMHVRILGLCPVREYFDEASQQVRQTPLFWVYFPEARNVLVRNEAFNPHNDAERRTYDDIFWKRMFSSYVYKESNSYDRNISQYAKGLDAMYESERVKDEIFQLEQNMWEY